MLAVLSFDAGAFAIEIDDRQDRGENHRGDPQRVASRAGNRTARTVD